MGHTREYKQGVSYLGAYRFAVITSLENYHNNGIGFRLTNCVDTAILRLVLDLADKARMGE